MLINPSTFAAIDVYEAIHAGDAHLVVCQSENKAYDKETLFKGEHAVVDGKVLSCCLVVISDGGMSVQAPHLVARSGGEQTYLHGVHVGQLSL